MTPLEIETLSFAYDAARPVLKDLSLSLQTGEKLSLIGGNGSGKSTLLHLLVGLLRPAAGTIRLWGQTVVDEVDFRQVRRRIGLLFQNADDQLFCPTVSEDVAFGPLNLGCSRREVMERVSDTLDTLGLAGYGERISHKLSVGEKKLVALASVLAMQPDVLLLDEPAAALDHTAEERLIEILRHLPQSMIIVSHNPRIVNAIATRKLLLQEGALTESEFG